MVDILDNIYLIDVKHIEINSISKYIFNFDNLLIFGEEI